MAAKAAPAAVPRMLARGERSFAMEFLAPARYPVWKELLRRGDADAAFAGRVGHALASIHAFTAGLAQAKEIFTTDQIFHAIRLEPYLLATATRHPDLSGKFENLVKRTAQTRLCLVHGDVSPKNILAGPDGPVFLDAECAWYGDPAFDLAFCLNHLLLKAAVVPEARVQLAASFEAMVRGYFEQVNWESPERLEARAAHLLPALMLARVDGKSPVEYITQEAMRSMIRAVTTILIRDPVTKLEQVGAAWSDAMQGTLR